MPFRSPNIGYLKGRKNTSLHLAQEFVARLTGTGHLRANMYEHLQVLHGAIVY